MTSTGTQRVSGNSKQELGLLPLRPPSSQLQPSLVAQEAFLEPKGQGQGSRSILYLRPGLAQKGTRGALVDTGPRSPSSWERAQQWAGGGQCAFAVSEEGSLDPLQLLLMDETDRAGGASRSPCPGLLPQCSGIPGPSPITQGNSFC